MPIFKFPLPDIGEGVAEGEVVEWRVKEGDSVKEDDILCEVMTDKATVEIPCPIDGTVTKLRAGEGETVPVGSYLLEIEPAEGAHVPDIVRHGEHADEVDEPAPVAVAAAAASEGVSAAPASSVATAGDEVNNGRIAELEIERPAGQRALATPYTRRIARELGVDIERIKGSGEVGRVTEGDVDVYAAAVGGLAEAPTEAVGIIATPGEPTMGRVQFTPAPALRPIPVGERETRIPIRGVRKKIAERMHLSKSTAAHFTYVDEVDVTDLVAMRRELKVTAAEQGSKLTYLPFIMKAVVSALRAFPTLNGLTDDANAEFIVKHYINLGVAVDTDNGLMVPVVKNVDQLSILEIANEVTRIATDARNGKSKLDDLKDGTFTITNAGNIGGLFATPVINYPEAAILGVHAIKQKPWVVDGEIKIRDIMYLSISIDHRMNDGATGAYFMNHVVRLLEDPRRLLLAI